jgi:hypothetical protein
VAVEIDVRGQPDVASLATAFEGIQGVVEVTTTDLASVVDY